MNPASRTVTPSVSPLLAIVLSAQSAKNDALIVLAASVSPSVLAAPSWWWEAPGYTAEPAAVVAAAAVAVPIAVDFGVGFASDGGGGGGVGSSSAVAVVSAVVCKDRADAGAAVPTGGKQSCDGHPLLDLQLATAE